MSELFQSLKIKRIVRETKDAVSVVFDIPDNLKEKFAYLPGQYITLSTYIKGKEVRRSYSFSSSPVTDADPTVTVKKVNGGVFSTFINEDAFEGQVLQVIPPLGKFVVNINPSAKKHYVLFAGGSGVTPIMSIIKSVLAKETESKITLLYFNTDFDSIIFHKQIEDFTTQYADRFKVEYCLDNPPATWTGKRGRQSPESFVTMAREAQIAGYPTEYYICGPVGMMDAVKAALTTLGIATDNIHIEYFTAPTTNHKEVVSSTGNSIFGDEEETTLIGNPKATISLYHREYEIEVPKGVTILDAAKDADLDPPYACQMGVCTTCRAKLLEGEVVMDEREGLSDSEIKQGYILTCQSHPITPKVKLIYE